MISDYVDALAERGWVLAQTGGNCTALTINLDGGLRAMLTSANMDATAPTALDEPTHVWFEDDRRHASVMYDDDVAPPIPLSKALALFRPGPMSWRIQVEDGIKAGRMVVL